MITVTLNTAIKNLPKLVKQTIENCEETVIATDDGAVVMIDEHEWNNMLNKINALKDKKIVDTHSEVKESRETDQAAE